MTSSKAEVQAVSLVEHPMEQAKINETADIDDEAIRELARRRLATKRNLTWQFFEWMLIGCIMLMMAEFSYSDAMALGFIFCSAWGLRFIYRVVKFARPNFNGGVAEYLRKRREQQLEFECGRLKKMGAEYVANELSK